MNEDRNEQVDDAGPDVEQPPDPGSAEAAPSDPDLTRLAERAAPSREAMRLEFDPADEDGHR
jgi:hypothetical protein